MQKSWKVVLAFVGIFLAGGVSGGLIALRVKHVTPPPPQSFNPQLMRRMADQLELTKEQKEKINPIETRTSEEIRRLRRDNLRGTELAIEQMQDDIAAVLTPDQRVKFQELISKARERVKRYMNEQKRRDTPVLDRMREGAAPRN